MYALKQAIMIKHELHDTEVTIYHMDIRAFGKGYEQFYRRAMAEGIRVVKAQGGEDQRSREPRFVPARGTDRRGGTGGRHPARSGVLSQGVVPGWHPGGRTPRSGGPGRILRGPELATKPARSPVEGIFLGGVATGPKDIPDAIVKRGAAAMEAAMYLGRTGVGQPAGAGSGRHV